MNRVVHVFFGVALVAFFGVVSRVQAVDEPSKRLVTVQGQGKIQAVPDIARISISVSADGKDLDPVTSKVRQTMSQEIELIKSQGIAAKDIQTQYYSIEPQWQYTSGKSMRVGFTVSNSIAVTVHDMSKMGRLLSSVATGGATSVSGPDFDFENPQEQERKALVLAVEDAKAKATVLAETAGASLGPVETINQNPGFGGIIPRPMMRMGKAFGSATLPPAEPIATGEQSFTSDITMTFLLK